MYREKIEDTKWNFCLYQPKEELEKSVWTLLLGNIPVFASLSFADFTFGIFFLKENGRTFGTAYRKYEPNQSGAS